MAHRGESTAMPRALSQPEEPSARAVQVVPSGGVTQIGPGGIWPTAEDPPAIVTTTAIVAVDTILHPTVVRAAPIVAPCRSRPRGTRRLLQATTMRAAPTERRGEAPP